MAPVITYGHAISFMLLLLLVYGCGAMLALFTALLGQFDVLDVAPSPRKGAAGRKMFYVFSWLVHSDAGWGQRAMGAWRLDWFNLVWCFKVQFYTWYLL